MKYLDEFRQQELARTLVKKIQAVSEHDIHIMEICGTHTAAIFRHGIREVLPGHVNIISGPGCPVCVTTTTEIDRFIKLARQKKAIVTTFGDLMRVPGSESSLNRERANGSDVRIVYSPFDALRIARENPTHEVVFLGIGFETTAPTVAATIQAAEANGQENFSVFSAHKLLPPALDALINSDELKIDGFLCPGHVSVIIGTSLYQTVVDKYRIPCVVAGFEPLDILDSLLRLVHQFENNRALVEIQYSRAVSAQGNVKAMSILHDVFQPADASWRGIGKNCIIRSRTQE